MRRLWALDTQQSRRARVGEEDVDDTDTDSMRRSSSREAITIKTNREALEIDRLVDIHRLSITRDEARCNGISEGFHSDF